MADKQNIEKRDLPTKVIFEGEQLVAIRRLLESRAGYVSVINCPRLYEELLRTVSPPLQSCADTRQRIIDSASSLMAIDAVPAVEDIGYDDFQDSVSKVIIAGQVAYDQKPSTCEMVDNGDDAYSCARCFFDQKLDVAYE